MSDYISKSALIKALKNHPNVFEQFGHIESIGLENVIETINSQPTLDEKEIIRKAFERVVEQLNGLMPIQFNGFGKTLITVEDVIKILKEECGISE